MIGPARALFAEYPKAQGGWLSQHPNEANNS